MITSIFQISAAVTVPRVTPDKYIRGRSRIWVSDKLNSGYNEPITLNFTVCGKRVHVEDVPYVLDCSRLCLFAGGTVTLNLFVVCEK